MFIYVHFSTSPDKTDVRVYGSSSIACIILGFIECNTMGDAELDHNSLQHLHVIEDDEDRSEHGSCRWRKLEIDDNFQWKPTQRLEVLSSVNANTSNFKRSQSMRVSKRPKLKEEIEKRRKYVTLEEGLPGPYSYESYRKDIPSEISTRRNRKFGELKCDEEIGSDLLKAPANPRDDVSGMTLVTPKEQTLKKRLPEWRRKTIDIKTTDYLEHNQPLQTMRPKYITDFESDDIEPRSRQIHDFYGETTNIKVTGKSDNVMHLDNRSRPTFSKRYTMTNLADEQYKTETSRSNRHLYDGMNVIEVVGDREPVLQSKSPRYYDRSLTAAVHDVVASSRQSSPRSTATYNSPFMRQRMIRTSDDFIHIWRFGDTSEFMTYPKTKKIKLVMSELSTLLGVSATALDLLYQNRIIKKTGKLTDQIETRKTRVYLVEKRISRQVPHHWQTDEPDLMDPWEDEDPRVLMSCGHGITCENLYEYCRRQIENGAVEFLCPAVPNQQRPSEQCESVWDFTEVRKKACLSKDECNMFEIMLSNNKIQQSKIIYDCPLCSKYIESKCSPGGFVLCKSCHENYFCDYKFCVFCLGKWNNPDQSRHCGNMDCQTSLQRLQRILMTCPTKEIVGIQDCPTVRACPQCNFMVEHEGENCKHMDCPSRHCKTKFCFVCLQIKTDKTYWPDSCGGAFMHCALAPRQSI